MLVNEAPATGGPPRVLASVERVNPSSESLSVTLAANDGGFLLAARDGRNIDTGECGCNYDVSEGELVVQGGYDGSQRKVVSCTPADRGDDEQTALDARTGLSGFVIAGAQCGMSASVETVAADGARAPVPGVVLRRGGSYEFSYAEPFVAVMATLGRVRVVDLRDGKQRDLTLGDDVSSFGFAAQPDGAVVFDAVVTSRGRRGVYLWPPGAPAPSRIAGVVQADASNFVSGAGRLLFSSPDPVAGQLAPGLIGLDGGGLRAVGAPSAGGERKPLAFDGTAAAFRSKSCTGVSQVTVVDVTATDAPTGPSGCPMVLEAKHRALLVTQQARQGVGHVPERLPRRARAEHPAQAPPDHDARAPPLRGPGVQLDTRDGSGASEAG